MKARACFGKVISSLSSRAPRQGALALLLGPMLTALVLSGCGLPIAGGTTTTTKKKTGSTIISGSTTEIEASATDDSVENPDGYPLISKRVGAVGYNGVTVTVSTGKILKVRFTPGIQDQTVSSGGFSPQYSKLGVYIKVGTTSEPTPMLSNGLDGSEAQSAILDFSSEISGNCSSSDSSCRKSVTITVYKPNYDYWCFNYATYNYSYYCSVDHTHVYDSHPWNGTLDIQTDDTIGF